MSFVTCHLFLRDAAARVGTFTMHGGHCPTLPITLGVSLVGWDLSHHWICVARGGMNPTLLQQHDHQNQIDDHRHPQRHHSPVRHPSGLGRSRQHRRRRLEQRPAFPHRRLTTKLYPATLPTHLLPPPRHPHRSGCSTHSPNSRIRRHQRAAASGGCRRHVRNG